jgi:Tfp pilus assembly protein PilF
VPREPTPHQRASQWIRRGIEYDDAKNFPAAERAFREAIGWDPSYSDGLGYLRLGVVLDEMERYAEAEKPFRQALQYRTHSGYENFRLGWDLYRLKRYSEAKEYAKKAVQYDNDYDSHTLLGWIYSSLDEDNKAEAEYLTALRMQREGPHTNARVSLTGLVKLRKDRILDRSAQRQYDFLMQNKNKEAEREARRSLLANRQNFNAHSYLGIALERQGRVLEAAQAYRDAVSLDSKKADAKERLSALTSSPAYQQALAAQREDEAKLSRCFDGAGPCAGNAMPGSVGAVSALGSGNRTIEVPPALTKDSEFRGLQQQRKTLTKELHILQSSLHAVIEQKAASGGATGALDLLEFQYKNAQTAKASTLRTVELQIEKKVEQYVNLGFQGQDRTGTSKSGGGVSEPPAPQFNESQSSDAPPK